VSNAAKKRFFDLLDLVRSGRLLEATKGLRKALTVAPEDPNLLHLAAQLAERQGDRPAAAAFYRRALTVHPGWLEATFNLARLLNMSPDEAQRREALVLLADLAVRNPARADLWEALARLEEQQNLLPDSAIHWRKALALRPDNPEGRGQYLFCCRAQADWQETPKPDANLPPSITTVLFDDPALQKQAAQLYCAKRFSAIKPLPRLPGRTHERLRVGYLSSDFHAHATAFLMAELFTLHDRSRFEVFVYSYGVDDQSAIRTRIKTEAEHFTELNVLTPQQCAECIRADEIDILIDLKGHTTGGRLDILAYRPALVQAHWLGFPGTTGAAFIDFFFADATTAPANSEAFFTEKLVRLPHCYQINDRQKRIGTPKPKRAYGLPEDALVLASFNQTYKITPELFSVWCEVLAALPDAVLWLFESNAYAPENLRREAQARGIDPARLIFAKPWPLDAHLARYSAVDLALDTFPVGGHTTTSDALWTGTPVITMQGQSFVSRVAASVLRAAELPLLVTSSPEEYRQRILDFAHNKAARDSIRHHLQSKRETLPLFDTPRFVRDWEESLLSCVKPLAPLSF